jgi:tripartite-type tricarboxylate transporter receptor subunit TctC
VNLSCHAGGPPLPWGEVDARSAAGEGLRSIERVRPPHPNPLPAGEREFTAFAARFSFLVCILLTSTFPAFAQQSSDRTIRIIAPFTPGSPNDVVARLIAPPLGQRLSQSVVVDNRPGGGTTIGVKAAMSAEPDGTTLMISNSPTHFISPLVNKTFTYDPLKDFVPVAMIASGGLMLVIAPEVPAKTLAEFVAYAKAHPGKLNFGFGQGTLPQLVGEMLKRAANIDVANIPYKGGAQAVTDMLGGRVQMNVGTLSTLAPLVRQGKLRALAVTSQARNPELPDVPTMAEAGLPEVASVTYYGFFGPAGTPADAVRRINAAVNDSLKAPDVAAAIRRIGFEPHPGTPEDFGKLVASEMKVWVPIVQATGFQMN